MLGNRLGRNARRKDVIEDYLRRHDGVITLAQALSVGMSDQAVRRRVTAGAWRRCSPGVYFAHDRPFTDAARIRAAVWGYGSRAAATGLAAAWWLGVTKFAPDVVEVTVPKSSHGRSRPGSRLRRRDLAPTDVVEHNGLQVSALPFTVIEAAVRTRGGAKFVDSALQRNVELRTLWAAHLRNKGRHGSPAARRLLQAADSGARSEAERLLVRLLKSAGITGWKANHSVAGYRVDFAFPRCKVVLEVDGLAYHSDADDFQNDRVRQNAIALAGWQVLRFTWLDLTAYPERVIAEIRYAICAR
jgi:very-short-patch-repair endonuclease